MEKRILIDSLREDYPNSYPLDADEHKFCPDFHVTSSGVLVPCSQAYFSYFNSEAFQPKHSDIWICTYPKSGTTWLQELVHQVLAHGDQAVYSELTSTVDQVTCKFEHSLLITNVSQLEADLKEKQKRAGKAGVFSSHLAADLLPQVLFERDIKIIQVMRNPKDTAVSYYHLHTMDHLYGQYKGNLHQFLPYFLKGKVFWGSWFEYVKSWQPFRSRNHILFLQYEDMVQNLPETVRKIARFLDMALSSDEVRNISSLCEFKSMKNRTYEAIDKLGYFNQSISHFLRKGHVGDWRNYFTVAENDEFDKRFAEEMKNVGESPFSFHH